MLRSALILLVILALPACTVDQFTNPEPTDAAPQQDGAVQVDGDAGQPDTDAATADADGGQSAGDADAGQVDAKPQDAAQDAPSQPVCAPFGYKACGQPNTKCEVQNANGDATCKAPGTTPKGSACSTDSDCQVDAVCEVNLCRSLCQAVLNGPYGQAAWNTNGCGLCPGGVHYSNPRLPSWIGVCTY